MISIVIPVYNEEESIASLYKELIATLKGNFDYELIFIDDGSSDSSLEKLKALASKDKKIKVFSFRKNRGKAEALTVGFEKSRGKYIATIDADLQDKPSDIPRLASKMDEGWDVVCGWRKKRKDSFTKVVSSKFFNLIARLFWGLELHDYNCGLKLYSSAAAKSLKLYGGMHRFTPLLASGQGFLVTEMPVYHEKRKFGKSKYGISKIFTDLPDIFTMLFLSKYGSRPLHFFGIVGSIFFTAGVFILFYLLYIKITEGVIGQRPIMFLGMILLLSGIQIFFTGFLADLFISINKREKSFLEQDNSETIIKYSSHKT